MVSIKVKKQANPVSVFKLPWPPTVNLYYRVTGKGLRIAQGGLLYRDAVAAAMHAAPPHNYGTARLNVQIATCLPDRQRRDLDNLLKPLLDAIEKTGLLYVNDRQIDNLHIIRGPIVGRAEACLVIRVSVFKETLFNKIMRFVGKYHSL